MRRIALASLLLLAVFPTKGYIYKQYTTGDGLLSNMVYCARQDSKGFIWLGTDCGVNRFDGRRFQQFTVDQGLSDNEIFNIREDSKKRIWFLTYNGRLSYYYEGIIYNEHNDPSLKESFFGTSYHDMHEDSEGNLWFLCLPSGCVKMTPDKKFTIYFPERSIWTLYENRQGEIKFIADSILTPDGTVSASDFRLKDKTWSSCIAGIEEIFYCRKKEIMYYSKGKHQTILADHPVIFSGHITKINVTPSGRIWANTNVNGSYLLSSENDSFSPKNFLPGKIVMNNMEDTEKNTWFCTSGEGVFLLKGRNEGVTYFTKENGLADDKINSFLKLNDSVMILGSGNGTLTLIKGNTIKNFKLQIPYGTGRLLRVPDLQKSREHDVFYCASDIGLFRVTCLRDSLLFQPYSTYVPHMDSCVYNYSAKCCYPDTSGNCYATLSFGVYSADNFCLYRIPMGSKQDLRSFTHFFDSQNNLWTADIEGLRCNGRLIPLKWNNKAQLNRIVHIRECGNAIILAVEGSGILSYEGDDNIQLLSVSDGLASSTARRLFISGNNIFVATNQGISKLRYENGTLNHVRNYTVNDGLASNDVMDIYTEDDIIYAATAEGLCILGEKIVEKTQSPPSVYFGEIRNADSVYDVTDALRFHYNKQQLIITFIAPTYENPELVTYRYRIRTDGVIKPDWKETHNARIEFSSLEPGDYTFELSARKVNSAWSNPVSLQFQIIPPFWKTGWFTWIAAVLVSGLVAAIVIIIYRRKIRRELYAIEKREALNRERTRIATDIHDDLGSELTTIAINAEMIKHSIHAEGQALMQLHTLTESARVIIEKMGEIIWAVNATNDSLKNLIAYIHEYAGKLFESKSIHCTVSMPDTSRDYELTAAFRRNVFLIIKEAFNNIIKHSNASAVHLALSIQNDILTIDIRDNGNGEIPENESVCRNGMVNMKKRSRDLHGSISITGKAGEGTHLTLKAPLNVQKKAYFHT